MNQANKGMRSFSSWAIALLIIPIAGQAWADKVCVSNWSQVEQSFICDVFIVR